MRRLRPRASVWAMATVVGLHAGVLWAVSTRMEPRAAGTARAPEVLAVRLVAPAAPPAPPAPPIPEVAPPPPEPVQAKAPPPPPPPKITPRPALRKPPPRPAARTQPAPPPAPVKVASAPRQPAARAAMQVAKAAPLVERPARFDAAYLRNPAPVYPREAVRRRHEGQVLLRVQVDTQGRAREVSLERSSGHGTLDRAAREAVQRWSFVPAQRGDEAVVAWVLVPVTFRLEN